MTADNRADDDDLDSQLDRLNREFYTADPSDYFETRWLSLLVMAGRADNVLAMLTEGVTYGHIHATIADAATTPEGVRNFATIESQVLLHHASEALLRLYLAHVVRPPCPWLELASERFETFKKNLRSKLLNPPASALHAGVAHVFLRGPVSETGMDEERWSKAVGNLTSYLRMFARRWLDDAHRYNSLKHGLAVSPSPRTMAFYADGSPEEHVLGYGASLAYLESDVAKRRQAWTMTIDWIDVSQSLALTSVAQGMIKSLWEIARARYTGAPPPRALYDPPDFTPDRFRTPDRSPGKRFRRRLGIATEDRQ